MANSKPQDMIQQAVHQAKELEYEMASLRQDIDANRRFLRLFGETGNLTDEQAAWLADFYPSKGRGTSRDDEAVRRTREVKQAAREEIAAERGEEAPAEVAA